MGAAAAGGIGARNVSAEEFHSGLDLGPQRCISLELIGQSFTWRSAAYGELQLRSHYLCAEEAGRAEDAAAEAEVLAVEQGLMGEGISLRLSRRPLDYVCVDQHLVDGTALLRRSATFQIKRGERGEYGENEKEVCLMWADRPGLYAGMERDGRITMKAYSLRDREDFHFRLTPARPTPPLLVDLLPCTMGLSAPAVEVEELLSELPNVRLVASVVVFNSVITACERGRPDVWWDACLRLLASQLHSRIMPDVVGISSSIRACTHWPMAVHLLNQQITNHYSYNSALSAAGSSANGWATACSLLLQMRHSAWLPDLFSYTASIGTEGLRAQWQRCLELLQEMEDQSCQWQLALLLLWAEPRPTAVTFSAAMMACVQGSVWLMALRLLTEVPQAQLRRDLVLFGSGLAAAELGGAWRSSLDLLQMSNAEVGERSVITHSSALTRCPWAWAMQLLGEMPSLHLQADMVAQTSALLALADEAQWPSALALLDGDGAVRASPVTFSAVLRACEDRERHLQASLADVNS
eukprot:g15600.t1